MKLFKRGDPVAALVKARAAANASAIKIATIEQQRADALSAGAELEDIRQLAAALEREQRDLAIHRDLIAALEIETRRIEREQREKRKLAAILVLEEHFSAAVGAAAKVETALVQLSEAYREYETARHRAWNAPWPDDVLPDTSDKHSPYRRDGGGTILDARIGDALGMVRGVASDRLSLVAKRTAGMHRELASYVESYMASLRSAPLPKLFDEHDEAAA